ncbi:MAG: STAS domain-containing protein [Terriglobia bacterium]
MADESPRIVRMAESPLLVVLRVEGSLAAELVDLLEAESRAVLAGNQWLGLDLSGVTNIDSIGLRMLKKLARGKVQVINCPLSIQAALGEAWRS